jgi:hypothetical protein
MSTEPSTEIVVHRAVSVPLAPDRAFALFAERMSDWWPREHSIGTSAMERVVVEPRAGGRWFERGVDGTECQWGSGRSLGSAGRAGAALADRHELDL